MIFLLGGRGLVGSAFARVCEAAGRPYTILDRSSYALHTGSSCEILINANGNSRKPLAVQDPLAEFDASVRSVRASVVDFRFDKYVHLSSCDVYPDCSTPAATCESSVLEAANQSPYGFHKHLAEQCVRHAASRMNKDWLIFRCGGFVGPGLKKNAVFDILHGGPLWLDAESELQFLHTEDAARLVLALVDCGARNEVFNLCGRGTVALREVAARAGREVPLHPDSPRVRYDVAIDKIRRALPDGMQVPETRSAVFRYVDSFTER